MQMKVMAQTPVPQNSSTVCLVRLFRIGAGNNILSLFATHTEIAVEKNSTVVFPLPMDILNNLTKSKIKES